MTIKHGLHQFFLIDMKVTAKIPCPQLYLIQKYLRGPPPKQKAIYATGTYMFMTVHVLFMFFTVTTAQMLKMQ
jgi:hypothetical protein